MDYYKENAETWNKVAQQYQEKFMEMPIYNGSYDLLIQRLEKQKASILEIGCGPGNITKYLLSKRPDFIINGIDVAPNMIALAQVNNPRATFQVLDAMEIDKLQSKFDAIVCGFCIPYIGPNKVQTFVKNVCMQLVQGGIFYLSFVKGKASQSGYKKGSRGDRMYFFYHPQISINEALNNNQFDILDEIDVDYPISDNATETHTIIIAIRK